MPEKKKVLMKIKASLEQYELRISGYKAKLVCEISNLKVDYFDMNVDSKELITPSYIELTLFREVELKDA